MSDFITFLIPCKRRTIGLQRLLYNSYYIKMIRESVEVNTEEFSNFLLEKYDWIGLLLKHNRIKREIDGGETENCFICTCLGSKSI